MGFFIQSLIFLVLVVSSQSWDLSRFNITSYFVSSVAVYRNRAFLALPKRCNLNSTPSALEVFWTEDKTTHLFGTRKNLFQTPPKKNNCKDLQNAISLDIEPKRPKLWVLDKGTKKCPAKIVTYNLYHNDLSQSCELTGIPQDNLQTFTIDPMLTEHGHKAYIGDAGDKTLLVFSLKELKWWRLKLELISDSSSILSAFYIAISKTDDQLFFCGDKSLAIYSVNLQAIRDSEGPLPVIAKNVFLPTNVTFLGNKMGVSSGLETDYKGGLSYYLIRDYAIVRWEIGKPMKAEHHQVLAQSFESLPFVSQLFTGPQNGLWALVNPTSPEECLQDLTTSSNSTQHLIRAIKILKYNRFF